MDKQDSGWLYLNAPAKLNLFLEVVRRRDDGYHDIESLMTCFSLSDRLAFRPVGEQIRGEVDYHPESGIESPIPWEKNLVYRALQELQQIADLRVGMEVRIEKHIPVESGMGGGSSDAAAAILAANRLWGLNWPLERIMPIAATVGSDVPFFLSQGAAICRRRGDEVKMVETRPGIPVIVAKPPEGFSTPAIFSNVDLSEDRISRERIEQAWNENRLRDTGEFFFNRLEAAASSLSSWPGVLRNEFDRLGCMGHQMTGSGSAWFGMFHNSSSARRSAAILRQRIPGLQVFVGVTTISAGARWGSVI